MTRMRWNCDEKGCRLEHRTDPELLDGCFPGNVSMGDVDGFVELSGHLWVVDFKHPDSRTERGQERALMELARHSVLSRVYYVWAKQQEVVGWQQITPGGVQALVVGDTEGFRQVAKEWSLLVAPARV